MIYIVDEAATVSQELWDKIKGVGDMNPDGHMVQVADETLSEVVAEMEEFCNPKETQQEHELRLEEKFRWRRENKTVRG